MPKTLLLADDSVVIQKLVGLSFANEDVDLTTTDNGDDAIARARELKPDLVLADVVMPGKNGYEVCEAIKSDPELRHIPVLLLTGTFEAFDESRARTVGSDGHITKPFEAQALVDRVTDLLARPPAEPPLATTAPNLDGPAVTRIRAASVEDETFEFFDEGVQDLDVAEADAPASRVAAPPPLPATPSPLADIAARPSSPPATGAAAPPSPSPLPPLGVTAERRDETVALMPDAPRGTTPPIDDLAFDVGDEEAAAGEAATTIDLGTHGDADGVGDADGSLDDLLLDESPSWSADLEIGSEQARGGDDVTRLAGDLFDDGPDDASATPATPLDLDEIPNDRRTSLIMSDGDNSSDSIAFGAAPSGGPADGMKTMLADDLFGDAAPPPLPTGTSVGDDALDSVEDLMQEPEHTADEFDVSSSDLDHSIPAMPPLAVEPAPTPAAAVAPEIHADEDDGATAEAFSVSDGLLSGAPSTDDSAPTATATPGTASAPDLTPMMRDRVHETLERVAWEAFSDLSDTVVKQVVEKIESIAWEVIPQMAEAIIKEEIRRMKGETDE